MTPEKVVALLRDLTTLGAGVWAFRWGVTHESLPAMLISAGLMLGPTGVGLLSSWLGTPANPQSPPAAPPAPSPPSPLPSSGAGGEP